MVVLRCIENIGCFCSILWVFGGCLEIFFQKVILSLNDEKATLNVSRNVQSIHKYNKLL